MFSFRRLCRLPSLSLLKFGSGGVGSSPVFAYGSAQPVARFSASSRPRFAEALGGNPRPLPPSWDVTKLAVPVALAGFVVAAVSYVGLQARGLGPVIPDTVGGVEEVVVNWSGTHSITTARMLQPRNLEELEKMVAEAHVKGEKLRCMGSGLSPNGISFQPDGMLSLALLDRVLHIDPGEGLVTVQAGARVQEVANELREHGLSLQNYASIREQTIGGFTQVSAHGTGARIPPVDDTVVSMKLVTPALGTLELSQERDPHLFHLARVGLGCLGVVAEVTLRTVPAHQLLEHTFTSNARTVSRNHTRWLQQHQHLRYMWIPYSDTVVVVTNDPLPQGGEAPPSTSSSMDEQLEPFRAIARETGKFTPGELLILSGTELRDQLLALDPLNPEWVKRVNQAEAAHWRLREGYRVGWSDELLGFDCGGQQWVLEVAFPAGTLSRPNHADLKFLNELQKLIVQHKVPAPPPIEQRWSSSSASPMSPAYSPNPQALHSWVGIIMYLPEEEELREQITKSFKGYARLVSQQLLGKYGGAEHWAKIELPEEPQERAELIARVQSHYPAQDFIAARARLDPKNVLGNELVDVLFPVPQQPAVTAQA